MKVAVVNTIFLYHTAPVYEVTYDGECLQQPFLMVSGMNGRRMGGGFLMAPEGRPDDGRMDLCIAGQVTRRGVLALMPRFMKGTQGTHPAITTIRSRRVVVEAIDGTLPAHADGETICVAGAKLEVEVLAQSLSILVGGEAVTP